MFITLCQIRFLEFCLRIIVWSPVDILEVQIVSSISSIVQVLTAVTRPVEVIKLNTISPYSNIGHSHNDYVE